MYRIEKADGSSCPRLTCSMQVFHEAARMKAERVRIAAPDGGEHDLVRISNADYKMDYFKKRWPEQTCYFEYEDYDENEVSSLYLPFLQRFDTVWIAEACEYTVVLASLFLRHTAAKLYTTDKRMNWFIQDERLSVVGSFEKEYDGTVLRIGTLEKDRELDLTHTDLGPIGAFHNVFFLQGTGIRDFSRFRFAEIVLDEQAGIGSILNNLSRYSQACGSLGLSLVSRRKTIGRFPTAFLDHCLRFSLGNDDADDENTFFMAETAPYVATWFLMRVTPKIDSDILNSTFREELDEYADAVIAGRRVLGVLVRGTDYILVNQNTERRMATADEVIPVIDRCMAEDGLEAIFLATEDKDILERMRSRYGKKLFAVSQERHSLSELKGRMLLADLEREQADPEKTMIENTVNYLYALYMLSRCESFICSGHCNGYDLTLAFNNGRFNKTILFKEGIWKGL